MRTSQDLVEQGLARWYQGRLIPVLRGGDGRDEDNLFPEVPEDLSALTDDELSAIAEQLAAGVASIADSPAEFVTAEFTAADLLAETRQAVSSLEAVKAELASRSETPAEPETDEAEGEESAPEGEAEISDDVAAELAALGEAAAADDEEDDDTEGETDGAPAGEKVMPNVKGKVAAKKKASKATAIVASAGRGALPRPTGIHAPVETQPVSRQVALTAGAAVSNIKPLGEAYSNMVEVARVMQARARTYGMIPDGFRENEVVARADWRNAYPEDRHLTGEDLSADLAFVASVTDPKLIKQRFDERKRQQIEQPNSLVAAGGLCNPVTPYYNLQMLSTPMRPVQAALPSFNADRGGIIFVQPPALSAFTSAVGLITEAQDAAGGSSAQKSCLTVVCPATEQTDVDIIYHCLQFGNLGARSFPEQVAQASETTLAAHARLAEANLLTQIDTNSTVVTAGSLGLGASASLYSQVLAAANGIRSANRMAPDAILRLLLPFWSVDLIVSDVIRTQFERFDTDEAKVTALWRSFNIEPTYYIDSAAGRGQVFSTQGAGILNTFPASVAMYLFPEGSHLFLDGGVLELGIVRDSVLNSTNVFQLFGESFENAAFVGIQSLAIISSTCDNGKVSAPYATDACPYLYSESS